MENQPPVILGAALIVSFLAVLAIRRPLEARYVLKSPALAQARRQFFFDWAMSLGAGILSAAFNMIVYKFPLGSALNLVIGVVIGGFFLSLDMALARERTVIIETARKGGPALRLKKLYPLTRTLAWVAIVTAVCIVVVLGLVLGRDIGWLTQMGVNERSVNAARESVTYEILFVVAALLVLVMNVILSYSRNLKLLFDNQTGILERVTKGDLSSMVPVATANEFGVIAQHTNNMIEGLQHRIDLLGALKAAEEVQQNLLPAAPPEVPGIEIAAVSLYSEETGGDYYDFVPLSDGRWGVAVGDVSGHGIGSALLMATARGALRMAWDNGADLAEVVARVNRRLADDVAESGRFLTLFLLEVDPAYKNLSWVTAGHDAALLLEPDTKEFAELGGRSMAAGVFEETEFESTCCRVWVPGSLLVLGTDGVWETRNKAGELFGKDRFKEVLRAHAAGHPQEALESVIQALNEFRGGTDLEDDVTLVLIKLL